LSLLGGLTEPHWDPAQLSEFQADWKPSAEVIQKEIEAMTGSWLEEIRFRSSHVLEMHLVFIPWYLFWRALGVMLLGMAFFKWGHLQGEKPHVSRAWLASALVVGLPLTAWGAARQFASNWDPVSAFLVDSQFGYWGSLPIALGWMGLVHLAVNNNWLPALRLRLAAVGQTALSNYLLQTLLCTTIFFGRGLGLFGSVSRLGQMGIVLGVWAFQLWISPWWLAKFKYGPAEWLWRSLAYWQRQPMKRQSPGR